MARERGGLTEVELDVPAVADPARRDAHVAEITARVVGALAESDVLLFTSRTLLRDTDPAASLEIARHGVHRRHRGRPRRGGRRARPGSSPRAASPPTTSPSAAWASGARPSWANSCPAWCRCSSPSRPCPQVVGTPYVVFAGNVGDENTLAYVIDLFSGRTNP